MQNREIGQRLRQFREYLGTLDDASKMTRERFATLLGVKHHNINDYERGASDIPSAALVGLYRLGLNLNWLFSGQEAMIAHNEPTNNSRRSEQEIEVLDMRALSPAAIQSLVSKEVHKILENMGTISNES